jgi:hypothetical protein
MPPSRVERFIAALRTIRDQGAAAAPDWTNLNESDPGITLVELLSFVAEGIGARSGELPPATRAELARIAARVSELARAGQTGSPQDGVATGGFERNRFFQGRLLTPGDFEREQTYTREKIRRLQRACLSQGIVTGLEVEVTGTPAQPAVTVQPGMALDGAGELIEVPEPVTSTLPSPATGQRFVLLRYVERPTAFVPAPGAQDPSATMASRIEEGFAISVEALQDTAAVLLARLVARGGRWRIA